MLRLRRHLLGLGGEAVGRLRRRDGRALRVDGIRRPLDLGLGLGLRLRTARELRGGLRDGRGLRPGRLRRGLFHDGRLHDGCLASGRLGRRLPTRSFLGRGGLLADNLFGHGGLLLDGFLHAFRRRFFGHDAPAFR